MKEANDLVFFSGKIKKELKDRLKVFCASNGVFIGFVITKAIEEFLEKAEK